MTTTNKTFEVGTSYLGRFITDYDSVFTRKVIRRTAKFVWLQDSMGKVKKCGVKAGWDGNETCLPFGSYSMSPCLSADRAIAA